MSFNIHNRSYLWWWWLSWYSLCVGCHRISTLFSHRTIHSWTMSPTFKKSISARTGSPWATQCTIPSSTAGWIQGKSNLSFTLQFFSSPFVCCSLPSRHCICRRRLNGFRALNTISISFFSHFFLFIASLQIDFVRDSSASSAAVLLYTQSPTCSRDGKRWHRDIRVQVHLITESLETVWNVWHKTFNYFFPSLPLLLHAIQLILSVHTLLYFFMWD